MIGWNLERLCDCMVVPAVSVPAGEALNMLRQVAVCKSYRM